MDTVGQAAREREFQRGATEQNPQKGENEYEAWFANEKLTYDNILETLTAQARRSQTHFDQVASTERERLAQVSNVALQALQNAVETANMVSKQAVRHSDLAIDRQWNKEPAEGAADATILRQILAEPTISTAVAQILANMVAGSAPK